MEDQFVHDLFGLTEPIFVPRYWNPPSIFDLAQKTGFDVESLIFCFAIGGVGAALYDLLTGKRSRPMATIEKHLMTSSALVLFMTLPGLALFYGGSVRRKNALSVLTQCFGIAGLVTILWWAFGYSLVFGKNYNSPFCGGSEYFFFSRVTSAPNTDYAFWVSQNVYAIFQLMFAIITPALIIGAVAERMKYMSVLAFVTCWMFLVYFPQAHMVWGITGLMNGIWNANSQIKAIDFAGGTVVHMTSGWSALILCIILGPRLGFHTAWYCVWSGPVCFGSDGTALMREEQSEQM